MKFGVFGTGAVGRQVATRLTEGGHEAVIGTRDPEATLARDAPDSMGGPPYREWSAAHPGIGLVTFAEAAAFGDVVVNATSGLVSVAALEAAGEALDGKVVIDLANALDFSKGFPPEVVMGEYGSLGQELQARFPTARIVKVLNTLNLGLMFDPQRVGDGDHTLFMAGDDDEAKAIVRGLLEAYGWSDIIDLGGIAAARATELVLPLWLQLMGVFGHATFQFKVVR